MFLLSSLDAVYAGFPPSHGTADDGRSCEDAPPLCFRTFRPLELLFPTTWWPLFSRASEGAYSLLPQRLGQGHFLSPLQFDAGKRLCVALTL